MANFYLTLLLITGSLFPSEIAADQIIQEKKISFDRCIDVIEESKNRLSISPEISSVSNVKRVAIFDLSDGKLTITCDGEKGLLQVSVKVN